MPFENTLRLLEGTAVRHHQAFIDGRARQPALVPFATAVKAVSFASTTTHAEEERAAVVDAFLAEHQRGVSRLWQDLLFHTFAPMLVATRLALGPRHSEDLDQRLCLAFLEALRSHTFSGGSSFGAIERATCAAVTALRDVEATVGKVTFDGDVPETETYVASRDLDVREVLTLLPTLADEDDDEIVDLLVATLLHGESLNEYVDREYAGLDSDARELTRCRLRRERARMVALLNRRLTGGSFIAIPSSPSNTLH